MTKSAVGTSRRAFLAAFAALPLAACAAELGLEPTLPRTRFRDVKVDVSNISRKGLPNWSAKLGAAVERAARREFADLIDPRDRKAPVLTLRLDGSNFPLWQAGWKKFPLGPFGADDATDWLDGWVIFGNTYRHVAISRSTGLAGPWYARERDERRLEGLAAEWASWARREFPR